MCVDAECKDWWYADKVTDTTLRCRKGHFWAPDFVPKEFLKFLPGFKKSDNETKQNDKDNKEKPEQYDIGSEADTEEKTTNTAAATDQEEDKKKFEDLSRSIRTNQEGGWESPPGLLEEHERLRKRLSPEEQEKTEEPSIASLKRKSDKLGVAAKKAKQNVIDNMEKRKELLRSLEDNERNQKVFEQEEAEAIQAHQDALELHAKKNKEANAEKIKKSSKTSLKRLIMLPKKLNMTKQLKNCEKFDDKWKKCSVSTKSNYKVYKPRSQKAKEEKKRCRHPWRKSQRKMRVRSSQREEVRQTRQRPQTTSPKGENSLSRRQKRSKSAFITIIFLGLLFVFASLQKVIPDIGYTKAKGGGGSIIEKPPVQTITTRKRRRLRAAASKVVLRCRRVAGRRMRSNRRRAEVMGINVKRDRYGFVSSMPHFISACPISACCRSVPPRPWDGVQCVGNALSNCTGQHLSSCNYIDITNSTGDRRLGPTLCGRAPGPGAFKGRRCFSQFKRRPVRRDGAAQAISVSNRSARQRPVRRGGATSFYQRPVRRDGAGQNCHTYRRMHSGQDRDERDKEKRTKKTRESIRTEKGRIEKR